MKNKKYEALEIVIENIVQNGMDVESALAEFPEFADELRPLAQTALASGVTPVTIPKDVMQRGRARLLQHAAQMRKPAPAPLFDFRRAAVALALLLVFFISGTGLVRAASGALPGDQLYGVKRSLEETRFLFVRGEKAARLQTTYEAERIAEIKELFGRERVAAVQFEGVVLSQNGSLWNIAGVPVNISAQTDLDASISIGSDVIVSGQTQTDGVVWAAAIVISHPELEPTAQPTLTQTPLPPTDEYEETPTETEEPTETPQPEGYGDDDTATATENFDNNDDGDGAQDGSATPTPHGDETPQPDETPEADDN